MKTIPINGLQTMEKWIEDNIKNLDVAIAIERRLKPPLDTSSLNFYRGRRTAFCACLSNVKLLLEESA